jgi:two-component system OmpR family sensor kinase
VKSVYQAMKDSLEIMTGPLSDEIGKYHSPKEALELLTRNGIHLEFTPEIQDTEIFQDEIKFRQIVGNLLKNALHHRRERLEIKMDLQGDMMSLTVSDDGPGVDPDQHEMIFKRYAQVKECSIVPRKGHGLGLAGALILARCLGGDIKIISEKGQGAAFCLTLPVSMEVVD